MSFSLTDSNDLYCSCRVGKAGRGFFEDEIVIGDNYIKVSDFSALVMYFLTNTDLDDNDVRRQLMKEISALKEIEGYNKGNTRLG